MPLFHYGPTQLAPGSVILPGNWGRITINERLGQGFKADNLLKELTYELVRLREFPKCISRLKAAFAFENIDHCMAARQGHDLAYEVELAEPKAEIQKFCWNHVSRWPTNGMALGAALDQFARDYWSAANIQTPELLTLSGLRIVKQVG